jgi:MFS family permease
MDGRAEDRCAEVTRQVIQTTADRKTEARRVAFASAIGTTIEWYDFFIYGTAAAVVFAPQFFPQVSALAGTLASFATFAIGFGARPLGGIVMGHFGDRIGRKSTLVWCLLLMGISTFGIGLLPGYASIGAWAPALLVFLRFLQGFALGGEWGGAVLMSVEHAPQGNRGLFGSFVALGLPAGIILSNLVFLLASTVVSPAQFSSWAWRVPFLASGVLVAIGFFVRLRVAESPIFEDVRRARSTRRMPVVDVFRSEARAVLLAAGSYLSISATGYLVIVYFVTYATRNLQFSLPVTLGILQLAALLFAVSILFWAKRSDVVGRRRMMRWSCGILVMASLLFFPLIDTKSVPLAAVAVCFMLVVQGMYIGPQAAVFAELFPAAFRYSGASLSITLGTLLGGAITPLVATALYDTFGSSLAITVYAVTLSVFSWLCSLGLKETVQAKL